MTLKVASWNVNSIRARMEHVLDWMDMSDTDILCIQEIKVSTDDFPYDMFENKGWHVYVHGQKSYHGVCIVSKVPLTDIRTGFPSGDLNDQKRVIYAKYKDVQIVNFYVPQGESAESPKFQMKTEFYEIIQQWLEDEFSPEDKLLMCGDFNIAPEARDVYDPVACAKKCMFMPIEVEWLQRFMNWGFKDSFRIFNDDDEQYSWWDYRLGSVKRNKGCRIDQIFITDPLAQIATDAGIDKAPRMWERPSDHTPIWVTLDV